MCYFVGDVSFRRAWRRKHRKRAAQCRTDADSRRSPPYSDFYGGKNSVYHSSCAEIIRSSSRFSSYDLRNKSTPTPAIAGYRLNMTKIETPRLYVIHYFNSTCVYRSMSIDWISRMCSNANVAVRFVFNFNIPTYGLRF